MRHNTTKRILLTCMLLYMFANASGQVTIGSGIVPNQGSLLDLKQDGEESVNATKGLGMPRVVLSDLKKLKMGDNEIDDGLDDQYLKHTGLMVYNTSEQVVCAPDNIAHGLYVWDGGQWQLLQQGGGTAAAGVYSFTDSRDGQSYLARNFGDIAGDWMLENLAYVPTAADFAHTMEYSNDDDKHYIYPCVAGPFGDTYYPNDNPKATWRKEQGLLYNWFAATNGENIYTDTVDQRQGAQNEGPFPSIQGICPAGWHVPSDREWNELEKEIYQNANKYSTYTANEVATWNDAQPWLLLWEENESYSTRPVVAVTGAHGPAMISPCILPGILNKTHGKSLSAEQGGFHAVLAGTAIAGKSYNYGLMAYFWSASAQLNGAIWQRILLNSETEMGVGRYPNACDGFESLRCKKDN